MAHNPFLPYRVTPETARRNPKGFQPRFKQSQRLLDQARRIERLDQDLHHYEATSEAAHRLLRRALARNAYGTASIEGNPLTLQDVESLLEAAPGALDPEPDEREILNWASFMKELAGPFPRTVDDVCHLHARLFEGVLKQRGRIKHTQNFIGSSRTKVVIFIPSPPRSTTKELQAALDWLHEAPLPPIFRAALFFHEFQGIHPFPDGNGRTGRALFTWFLHAQGYKGIRYAQVDYTFNADRDPYYRNLSLVERNGYDYTPWVGYLFTVLGQTYYDAVRRFHIQRDHPNLTERQHALVEWFVRIQSWNKARRVKFSDVHAAIPHIPERSVQRDLATLVEVGVLEREGVRRGTKYRLKPD